MLYIYVSVSEKYIYVHKYKQEDTYICMYTIVKNKVYVCTCLYTYTVYVSKCDFYCVILCIYMYIYIHIYIHTYIYTYVFTSSEK